MRQDGAAARFLALADQLGSAVAHHARVSGTVPLDEDAVLNAVNDLRSAAWRYVSLVSEETGWSNPLIALEDEFDGGEDDGDEDENEQNSGQWEYVIELTMSAIVLAPNVLINAASRTLGEVSGMTRENIVRRTVLELATRLPGATSPDKSFVRFDAIDARFQGDSE